MTVDEILQPRGTGEFLRTVWGQTMCHLAGKVGRFHHILPWRELNDILREHRLQPPRLRLVRQGQHAAPEAFLRFRPNRRGPAIPEIVPERFSELLRDGYTLILDAIDEAANGVRSVAEALEYTLHEPVQVNLYAAWRDVQGFDLHWDDHDVLILQVYGRKHWRVYRGGREFPLHRDVEPNTTPPSTIAWEGEMRDGDVLYLPRGWWHEAAGCGDPTLHLTFGITKRSGITFMEWLVDELRRFPIFRADLPRFADQETQRGHAKAMLDALLASWDDAGVDRYLTSQDVRARLRPWLNLPLAAGVDLLPAVESIVSLAIPRQVPIHQTGTSVTIAALGREWEFDALVGEMLERLQAGPATVGEIAALLSPSAGPGEAQKFVADLVRRGLLNIDYPTVAEALP